MKTQEHLEPWGACDTTSRGVQRRLRAPRAVLTGAACACCGSCTCACWCSLCHACCPHRSCCISCCKYTVFVAIFCSWRCTLYKYCYVWNTAQHCRLGLFQDSDFAGDLEDSQSTSGGLMYLWKWEMVIEVPRSSKSTESPTNPAAGNCSRNHKSKPKQKGNRDLHQLSHVDYVTTNANSTQSESQLYIFEDNEAVIKMIIKSRSPTMRHVSRTHRVAVDWLFDRIILDPKIQIKHVDTKTNSQTR